MARLRIGSRGSRLALWQANHVAGLLRAQGHTVEIEIIKTTGDKITDVALAKVGTKGMFTKEIEEALAEKRVDLAVHSLKDVPTELQPEFELAVIMKREDPRDAFVSPEYSSLEDLPRNARVGTSSLRRQCQLKALRPGLEILSLRGNVDTRIKKLEAGEYAAIILAAAGVGRLGLDQHVRQIISPETMCPAAGQGALAIETRRTDTQTRDLLAFMDDVDTRNAIECERALLAALGGGCQVPIGAYAQRQNGALHLISMVGSPDGSEVLREQTQGGDPQQLGRETAQKLLARGADRILQDVYSHEIAAPAQP
ncbi:MAG TPA: hydroxymethylbilane synthase [Verrucomicrobiae bacterium]|jgi:hydroxymethylbilane synthase|nr:hydroxymethylbilane synthase [Verrucomicrobiae bacterium]